MDTKEESITLDTITITDSQFGSNVNAAYQSSMSDTIDLSSLRGALGSLTTGGLATGANGSSATDWITGSLNTVWTTSPNITATSPTWTINSSPAVINQGGQISLTGEQADIEINGRSMKAWMEKVEERLNILTPNPELEKEWDDLRRLGERYRKLEKKCKEKAEVWKKLKAMPPPKLD